MHKERFADRDLKPQNIFVRTSLSPIQLKLGDFGISKRLNADTMLRTLNHTPAYVAPEILEKLHSAPAGVDEGYSHGVDVWSVGIIAFELLTGKLPFNLVQGIRRIPLGRLSGVEEMCGGLVELVDGMLRFVPKERMGVEECLRTVEVLELKAAYLG